MMRAVEITEPGGPDVLKRVERPKPKVQSGEVLIEIVAAGVNRPDCLQRAGVSPPPAGASDLPGLEVAGRIVDVGEGVPKDVLGRDVMALTNGGGYADYVAVNHGACIVKPQSLSFQQAGALPETLFTVWHNVFRLGKLERDNWFLVHGGSSGIGTMAIQLAKAFGAKVIATAGTNAKCQLCETRGADSVINYKDADFVEEVKRVTDNCGANVILDMVGGSYVARNHKAAARDGRIIQIATLGGAEATINVGLLMMKRLVHTGSTLRAQSDEFKAALARELESKVLPLIDEGTVLPGMHSSFDLEQAANAHRLMESGDLYGKIELEVRKD